MKSIFHQNHILVRVILLAYLLSQVGCMLHHRRWLSRIQSRPESSSGSLVRLLHTDRKSSMALKGVLMDFFLKRDVSGEEEALWKKKNDDSLSADRKEQREKERESRQQQRRMEKELIRMNGSRSEIFTTCFQAMEIYKQLYNTTFVPRNYVVPQNATSYPEALWGCRLGGFYDGIYHNGNYMNVHYFDKLVELDVIGVYFPADRYRPMPSVQQLQKALEIYRSIYGNCRIPEDYVIRSNASKFPRELRGSLFGQLIRDIRQGKRYCGLLQRRIWRSFGLYDEDEEGHSMEEKFVIIFKALKIFRKEHGHLQVSRNFVIPNNDELFPPDSWGLPLGMILSNIRNLGSWCTTRNHVTKLASIDAIACYYDQDIFRLMPSGNDVYNALQTFFQLHGHLDIPLDYVVPSSDNGTNSSYEEVMHGCALGRVLQDIKLGKQYIATQFKALWKSCNISITSSFVANLTENVQQQELRERFDALVTAIEIYKDIYGNISVVQSYVTPSSDEISLQNDTVIANPFPLQCRNFSLGDYVYKIRGVGRWMRLEFVFRLKDLGVINFYFEDDYCRPMPTTKQVQAALQAYFNIFGNYAVPATYVIDSKDERFPASMRGCALGKLVEDIHYRRQYTNMHATEIWQRMGLFEGTDKHEFTLFCEAMQAFVRKHKHTIVRQSYVVPADSPIYPKSTWNLPLGELYAKARRGVIWHYPPNYAQLLELGVIKNYYKNGVDLCPPLPSLSLLKQAIEVYHCLHNNYDIPSDFIFSEKIIKSYKKKSKNELDEKMKAQLIGLHLGEVMEDVQQGTLHNDVRARSYWSSLNISFSKPVLHRELQVGDANREKFNMVRDALQAYKSVYGNTHVSEDFVVPANSTDFPEHCLGFALGYSVFSIKRYGSWMREEFIEDLKATGVVNSYFPDDPCKKMPWWTEVESSLLTYQQQHGNLDVPATYVLEDSTLYPSEMIGYDLGLILQDIRAEKQYCNKKLSAKWRKMGILAPKEKPKK